jgi:hypothetical protein
MGDPRGESGFFVNKKGHKKADPYVLSQEKRKGLFLQACDAADSGWGLTGLRESAAGKFVIAQGLSQRIPEDPERPR